eukprot:Gb_25896 [translate_table: standard]
MAKKIVNEEEWMVAMEFTTMASVPMSLKVAVELDVFEIIAKLGGHEHHVSPAQIVSQMSTCTNPNAAASLDRILRVLASNSVLSSSLSQSGQERLYGLTPNCKYFVKNEDGISLSHLVLVAHHKVFMETWNNMADAILHGGNPPFTRTYGVNVFEYCGRDPSFNELFNNAMSEHSTMVVQAVLDTYDGFKHIEELVDVAGGMGTTLNMIVSKYPHIRVVHVGGNMFESVPPAKTIFTKWNLLDYSDDECLKLLKNCYVALPEKGKLIVVEDVLPVATETSRAARNPANLDLMVFGCMPSGRQRTEQEFRKLAKASGFADIELVCCANGMWVIEFYK